MPKQNIIATNFTSGEVSPLVRGRVDAQKYANGLETCENFIVRPQGPLCRRSGSKYLGPIKFPGNKAVLIPFEYSDTQGYVLEFGRGYIHFWKNNGMLFETTTTEIESFNTANNSGLIQVIANKTALPVFGNEAWPGIFNVTGVGTAILGRTTSGNVRVTTSVPHTLRTNSVVSGNLLSGTKAITNIVGSNPANPPTSYCKITITGHGFTTGQTVLVKGVVGTTNANTTAIISVIDANTFILQNVLFNAAYVSGGTVSVLFSFLNKTITWITNVSFDINNSTWDALYQNGTAIIYTSGVLPGDRIYISGASDVPEINNKFAIVQSHDGYDLVSEKEKFTLNIPFFTNDTSPQGEDGWTIPIEIATDYGYLPSKSITSTANDGTNKILVTASNHNLLTGDTVNIYGSNSEADGDWVITLISANTFTLNGSTHLSSASYGYYRKKLDPLEDELRKIKVAQSNDVIYIMHPYHPTYKLVRLTNDGDRNDWLFAKVNFKDGPYLALNSLSPVYDETTPSNGTIFRDVYFEISGYSHTATVVSETGWTASAAPAGDQNGYIEYRDGDQWRLAKLPSPLTAGAKTATVDIIDNVLLHMDETTKLTQRITQTIAKTNKYNSGSQNTTPSVPGAGKNKRIDPNNTLIYVTASTELISNFSNTFGTADVGKYVRYFTEANPPVAQWSSIDRIVSASAGAKCKISAPLNFAVSNPTGKFIITNETRSATLKSYRNGVAFSAFNSTDVNRIFRIGWGGRWTWGKITAFTSASQVSVVLYEDIPRDPNNAKCLAGSTNGSMAATGSDTTTGRSYDWRLGAWSETTGYPTCGSFHEQRFWMAANATENQTIWASVSGDFENFCPTELDSTVLEDNAINFSIGSTKANAIKWMSSGTSLTVGTTGAEWQIKSSSATSEPISPTNIVIVPHTQHGTSGTIQPIKIGPSTLFCDRPGKKVRELVYDFSVDSLTSKDLTYISEHLFRNANGSIASAYQQDPNNLCWFVMNDGTLSCLTINKEQEIVAWHRHLISGGLVESIAVVPGLSNSRDLVYMVVNRENNRYIELLQDDFYPSSPSTKTNMMFLDGLVELDSRFKGTVVAGLHHLEGKTVTVTMNGIPLANTYQVSGGKITVSPSQTNSEMHVGLPYTSTARSLPPEGGSAFGVSQGKIKKIAKYNVRLLNSLEIDYGFNTNGQSLNSLTNLHENGTSTDFYTGTKELVPNNPYDAESQWTLSTSKPYPLNILSVTMTVETGE